MGRANVKDGLAAQLKLVNGFEGSNTGTVAIDDYRVLGAGVDRAAIVLTSMERPAQQRRLAMGKNEVTWYLDVELYIRHNGDPTQARRDADTYAQNIIQRINDNSTLGGSAFDSMVIETVPQDENYRIGSKQFLLERLTVTAEEHLSA